MQYYCWDKWKELLINHICNPVASRLKCRERNFMPNSPIWFWFVRILSPTIIRFHKPLLVFWMPKAFKRRKDYLLYEDCYAMKLLFCCLLDVIFFEACSTVIDVWCVLYCSFVQFKSLDTKEFLKFLGRESPSRYSS